MAKSLAQLQKEIAALQRQADAIKEKEVKDVIARVKEAIAFYGLTASDLGLGGAKRGPKPGAAKKAGRKGRGAGKKKAAAGKIKYRDENGNTWTGHGRRPQWFIDAVAGGKTPEQLAA
ncbi:H-NS family nucleoid-associated regulatory protein [Caldimonas sp. KR1-144]|uniref:H-NS histone family protein n=1 Tax=Caldimonas sp. KR1-144 TaxID=3400911 RepID=UPI003C0D7209